MTTDEKRHFLVCYDYGMGGLLGRDVCTLRGGDRLYPELYIAHERPSWMSDDRYEHLLETRCYDIDGMPSGLLDVVIDDRTHD